MPLLKFVHLLQKMNKKVICTLIKIIYDVKKNTSKSQISYFIFHFILSPGNLALRQFKNFLEAHSFYC